MEEDLFAGARTFALLSLLGCGGAFAVALIEAPWIFAALLLVVGALITAAYVLESRVSVMDDVTFQWEPVEGAAAYDVQLLTSSGGVALQERAGGGPGLAVTTELRSGRYAWRVRAVTGNRAGPWSAARTLHLEAYERAWSWAFRAQWDTSAPSPYEHTAPVRLVDTLGVPGHLLSDLRVGSGTVRRVVPFEDLSELLTRLAVGYAPGTSPRPLYVNTYEDLPASASMTLGESGRVIDPLGTGTVAIALHYDGSSNRTIVVEGTLQFIVTVG